MTGMRSLFIGIVAVSTFQASQPPDLSRTSGNWSGVGQFFSAEVQKAVGPLPVTLQLADGRPVAGKVGEATMRDLQMKSSRDRIELTAKLSSRAAQALDKDHVVLVVTAVTDSSIVAEFHLKSNGVFDPFMREGRVQLSRNR